MPQSAVPAHGAIGGGEAEAGDALDSSEGVQAADEFDGSVLTDRQAIGLGLQLWRKWRKKIMNAPDRCEGSYTGDRTAEPTAKEAADEEFFPAALAVIGRPAAYGSGQW
ncbi:hypothetical protein MMC08_000130 [Hypocenomyce scalaris]|nr:hypothetical protein [Hypocenomyce scalaris]